MDLRRIGIPIGAEARLRHAEWPGDFLLEPFAERHLGHGLHRQPRPIDAHAVLPLRSRIEQQRQIEARAFARRHLAARHRVAQQIGVHEGIAAARSVQQQVAQRHRGARRAQDRRAILAEPVQHLRLGQFGQDRPDRRIEIELAALDQLQHRHAGQRLGHRGDLEQRVLAHRHAVHGIGHARHVHIARVLAVGDQRHRTRQVGCRDNGLEFRDALHIPSLSIPAGPLRGSAVIDAACGARRAQRGLRCSPLTQRTVPELARITTLSVVITPLLLVFTPASSEPSVTPVAAKMQSPLASSLRS